ncbi:MAG TPA: flagellar M-ring protein FliF [Gammaproteobacteria bacterium]|nr:flagellar M-ring protein FliF [Gammaproteobacteria bacterium]
MLQEIWRDASVSSRTSLVSGFAIILLLGAAAVFWLLRDDKVVLFADLEAADAAAVVTELERMKVDYALGAGGTKILVPEDIVHEVRLKLMGSGLAMNGGLGFEIFDDSEFGMTEFAQRINFQRALQGELTRTIMSLEEVKFARVHLVMPQTSLFKQNKSPPSASVTLFLKPGRKLERRQIEGIQRLVAASVPALDASLVTIVDQKGNTMSRVISDEQDAAPVSMRLQKKREVEDYLRAKVASVLARTFGAGRAIVSVDVTLNFDQKKTTREEVIPQADPNGGVIRKRESRSGGGKDKDKRGSDRSTEIEYRLGRAVAQVVSTPGNIRRLSVGVLVPHDIGAEQLRQVRDLVAMTVGFDSARGDAIAVHRSESRLPMLSREDAASSATENTAPPGLPAGTAAAASLKATGSATVQAPAVYPEAGVGASPPRSAVHGRPRQILSDITDRLQKVWRRHAGVIAVSGIALTLILLLIVYAAARVRRRRLQRITRKSAAERERILEELREWMNADDMSITTESGGA